MASDVSGQEQENQASTRKSCPHCGAAAVNEAWCVSTFPYGAGAMATDLEVTLPVWACQVCAGQFLDYRAERIKTEAICRHLRILTPAQVRKTRQIYSMSLQEFAEVTGIDPERLEKWEAGHLSQTLTDDRLVRLLSNTSNMATLRALSLDVPRDTGSSNEQSERFRELGRAGLESHLNRQRVFSLRPTG